MKTIGTRTIFFLVCILACWVFPSSILASVEVDGIFYELNTSAKTAAVTSNPDKYTGAIDIPSSFDYNGDTYNVKSISSLAFLNCSEMTTINFPSSVTSIGSSAFERCAGLTDVVIGSGVTLIDYEAFKNCSNLRSLTLPSSLKTIENETFSGCTSLVEIIAKRTTPPTIVNTTFDGVDKTACIVYVPDGCQSTYAKAANWKVFSNILERSVVATGSCGDNVAYTIYSDMTMVISGTGEMWDYYEDNHIDNDYYHLIEKIIIEDGVSTIGAYAFKDCAELKSISISNSVGSIGYSIFWNCTSLTSVVIPSEVKSIDDGVFSCCPGLTSIQVSTSNTSYDSRENCNAIIETASNRLVAGCQNTYIPNSVTSIGQSSFDGCTDLTSISIPNSVTSIGWYSFHGCTGLTSLIIPNSVTNIEGRAFSGCSGLTSLSISNSVTIIEEETFSGCSGLTSLTIPNSVTRINEAAFEGCSGLTSLVIPSSVTSIGGSAFLGCTGLISVTIPSNLNQFGLMAFGACPNISKIYSENNNPPVCNGITFDEEVRNSSILYVPSGSKAAYKRAYIWSGFDHIVEARDSEILANGFCGDNLVYTIYSDMTMVISGTGAMWNHELYEDYHINDDYYQSIQSLIIEDGVTSIGHFVFSGCTSLTSVEIPSSVASININAFRGCTGLTSISVDSNNSKYDSRGNCNAIVETATNQLILGCKNTIIPNSVTSIGICAFEGCTGLTSVTIPNSVVSIGSWAFSDCSNMTYVNIGNCVTTIGIEAFFNCSGLTSLTIPNSVTSIDSDAFSVCTGLTSVTIGNSVSSIGGSAFYGCIGLTSVTIPSSVNSIGVSAFGNCSGLTSISVDSYNTTYDSRNNSNAIIETATNQLILGCKNTIIPNNVTRIGSSAFDGCTGLTTIAIPNSVNSIGSGAFYGCTGLTSLTIPSSVNSIDDSFFGCTSLTSVSVADGNTTFDSRNNCNGIIETANNCLKYGFKNTIIPNSVTSIGNYAFLGCIGLTSVTIPSSVTSIGQEAFGGCNDLTSIYLKGETPPLMPWGFDELFCYEKCTLYVRLGSKSAYQSADGWKYFSNIIEMEFDTDISTLDNALYVDRTEGRIGGTMDIPVKLKNNYPVRGFIFTMELPEGATINSWKLSSTRLPSGATLSDKFSTQKIEGNKINVACSLNYGDATFTGNDGEIASVNVTFSNDMEVGEYPIYLTACDISDADGTDNKLSDIKATLVLEDYVEGDANGDGVVLIGDVIAILNYIVGVTSNNFNEKAADVNGDGEILIGDVIAVLNIIVSQ